jgi:transcription antitermination factor NusG
MKSCKWIAAQVRANREFSVSSALQSKGYETFVPAYQAVKKWSDRRKACELPLIPGYVLVHSSFQKNQSLIVSTPGVLRMVGFAGQITPIEDHEIDLVRALAASSLKAEPWAYIKQNARVRIAQGSLAGIEGTVLQVREKTMLIVSIEILQRSVAVHIDRSWVEPQSPETGAASSTRNPFRTVAGKPNACPVC